MKLASLLLRLRRRIRRPQLPQDTRRAAPCQYETCHHNHPEARRRP